MSSIDLSKLTAAESPEDREAAATEVAKQVTSKVRSRRLKRTSDPHTSVFPRTSGFSAAPVDFLPRRGTEPGGERVTRNGQPGTSTGLSEMQDPVG